ncbi:MAG: hypothetical protein COA42_22370 [Alteromonadaceae bacterium]|nr:MAG: hypothetical protein COA42_22370 [Alteromonadaceae bacterium]
MTECILPSTERLKAAVNTNFEALTGENDEQSHDEQSKGDSAITLTLTEVNISSISDTADYENISLVFTCEYTFPQQTINVTHAELGSLTLFLVPVGNQEEKTQYEALINREVSTEAA